MGSTYQPAWIVQVPRAVLRRCWELKRVTNATYEAVAVLRREGHPDPPGTSWAASGTIRAAAAAWDRHLVREIALENRRRAIRRLEIRANRGGPLWVTELRDLQDDVERIEAEDQLELQAGSPVADR